MKKTIYLANPYGFSFGAKTQILPEIKRALEHIGYEVWEPFERNNQIDFSQKGWAQKVGQADHDDVVNADEFFGIINGCPPDEGVCVELGIAIAHKKPIWLFRDDFRRCTDSEEYPLNLMLFYHLGPNWRDRYLQNFGDIYEKMGGVRVPV